MPHLVWFRRDLRTTDHTALLAAASSSESGIVGVFVVSPEEWRRHDEAPAKVDFWLRNAAALSGALARLNIPLAVVHSPGAAGVAPRLLELARASGCDALHFNREFEVDERRRDEAVTRLFRNAGLAVHSHDDHTIVPPDELRTGGGSYYSVFTPFKRAWMRAVESRDAAPRGVPARQPRVRIEPGQVPGSVDGFESGIDPATWPAGEPHASRLLQRFTAERLERYHEERDRPDLDSTSRLSPYLAAGVISPRQCLAAALPANRGVLFPEPPGSAGPATWISELVWREFYQHVLAGFPRISMGRAFKPATDRIEWSGDEGHFASWCQGRTGVPIVDAAMRQLKAQGWMHNRLRMITAMYLTKDLFIDWRRGERWFMQHLVDGDLGSNNGGWQWSASTGTDAAPYFRIFNPITQSERCDPDGAFIRRWVPELATLKGSEIHDPSALLPLARAGLDYPLPLVDHRLARDRAVQAFKALDR